MLDNKINSQDFINFCNETLDISGKIALAHFRDVRDLTIKVDESPVTLADKQIPFILIYQYKGTDGFICEYSFIPPSIL